SGRGTSSSSTRRSRRSRARWGSMPRAGTRSASSDERAWAVPESLRATLGVRYGPVYSGPEADRHVLALETFGACGDLVTARAIELAHPPLIGIVDLKTRRNEPIDPKLFRSLARRRLVRVKNPPGFLTERLRDAVRGELSKLVKAPKDRVIIERMNARYGTAVTRGDAVVYESAEAAKATV